jgi:hypothetical protein
MQRPGTDVRNAGTLHDRGAAACAETTTCRLDIVLPAHVSRLPGVVR